ncbi:MAG: sulfatase/phosphatase domain-containing protein, partial [Planctomycetota bacterium]
PAGVSTEEIAVTTDIFPSIAKLTGAETPSDRVIDGKDVLDILLGKSTAKSPHHLHYYETDAIRRGKWKMLRKVIRKKQVAELYNLEKDPGERRNLAKQNQKMVAELGELLDAHNQRVASATRPAAFVDDGKATPLISEPGTLPKLRDYLDKPDTIAFGSDVKGH